MNNNYFPIFIIGTGRCGSTVFHRIMVDHPEVSFLTNLLDRFPEKFTSHRVSMKLWHQPLIGRLLSQRLRPSEAWNFWNHHVPGFRSPFRDLRSDDVMNQVMATLHRVFPQLVTKNHPYLLLKLTGWTRVGFVKKVFPEAKIIHVIRDPRAVVNSMLNVSWWRGWQGPEQWRWGPLNEEEQQVWKRYDESFLVLAAIAWCKIMRAYQQSLQQMPAVTKQDIMEIHYGDLCDAKETVLERVLSFCDLDQNRSFERALQKYKLTNRDHKWKENFSGKQRIQLEAALQELQWQTYLSS